MDLIHGGDQNLARRRVADQGKGSSVDEVEAENTTVEPFGGIQVADSEESNLLPVTDHLIDPVRYASHGGAPI